MKQAHLQLPLAVAGCFDGTFRGAPTQLWNPKQVHAASAAAGVETGSGPLEVSLPGFVAQTFQERYKVRRRAPWSAVVPALHR